MLKSEAADDPIDLDDWSGPIIFHRLRDCYRSRFENESTVQLIAYMHYEVWRALITGDVKKFATQRRNLIDFLARRDFSWDGLDLVDAEVMTDLLENVMSSYGQSMHSAIGHHLALIKLAGRLKSARYAPQP